jgi:hypothetical protein
MTRTDAIAAIAAIAQELPLPRLRKLLIAAYNIRDELGVDLHVGELERTVAARQRQTQVEQLLTDGRTLEAEKLAREP